jgi:hypothetical protein
MVEEAVADGGGVYDEIGGIVAEGNLVAVEAGFDRPHERGSKAKIVTNKSKLDLTGFCIDHQFT